MHGLLRYDGQTIVTYRHSPQKENTLNHNLVAAFAETEQALWIGTWGTGNVMNRMDRQTGHINRIQLTKDINTAYSAALTLHDGSLMIGGANSICHLLPGSNQHDVFPSKRVDTFWEDTDHTVWASSQDGKLRHFRTDKLRLVLLDSLRFGPEIRTIVSDRQGHVWLGTNRGVQQWRGQRQSVPSVLKNKDVLALCAASDGALWIGTQGMACFDGI